MSHLIQIFEYEKLLATNKAYFPNEEVGKKVIDRLWQYNDTNKNIYFEAIRNGIKFKQYVGVIQIGNITIEILPKTDRNKSTQTDKQNWHDVLLKMLARCRKIRVDSVSEASLKKRYHSLLDLYFRMYLKEVDYLLEKGLVKKYHRNSGNLKVLKGRLEFAQNIKSNLIHKERFYTSHQVYDSNHNINQILFKGLLVLKSISSDSTLTDSINRILGRFPDVDSKNITKLDFDNLVLSRKNKQYQEALKIAKMIILNYSPDIKGGNENMIALLFDMNKLWEEFVLRILKKANDGSWKIYGQESQYFWKGKTIRPDIVLHKDGIAYVIDTKWKVIPSNKPSVEDLKQMYVYNHHWKATHSVLLYPNSGFQITNKGLFALNMNADVSHSCQLGFVHVMDKDGMNKNLANQIFSLLI
jgi:5-methylcytosine-specific restriction enzyme subunit McrC